MAALYHLTIISPESTLFEGEVASLIVPGSDGYFEILAHHAALMSALKEGQLTITLPGEEKLVYFISGGVLEVSHNKAILLADDANKNP